MSTNMTSLEEAINTATDWWLGENPLYTSTNEAIQNYDQVVLHGVKDSDDVWHPNRIEPRGREDQLGYELPDQEVGEAEVLVEGWVERTRMENQHGDRITVYLLREPSVRDRRPRS